LRVVPIITPVQSDETSKRPSSPLGASREAALSSCPMHSRSRFAHRSYRRSLVPAVYAQSAFARDGGLLSYGVDLEDTFRLAATYFDRILRGEKPGDLPVQFPTKFEMAVNLKTAKALGLAIPPSILPRVDEVLE